VSQASERQRPKRDDGGKSGAGKHAERLLPSVALRRWRGSLCDTSPRETRGEERGSTGAYACLWASVLLSAVAASPALAQTAPVHGRLEVQDAEQFTGAASVQAQLGERTANDALGNLRITWEPTWGAWSLQAHYVVAAENGPSASLARAETGLIPQPPATWLSLTDTFVNRGPWIAAQRIDRLSLTYTTPDLVVRVGRQALTWGSGLVFRPMDLFDPFGPTATDTEHKPGVDMLYIQRLFADGSDLQFILAPRPARPGGPVTVDASSAALHFHTTVLGHAATLLAARDHGDWVTGVGVNGSLGGATWNVELVPTVLRAGGVRVSGVANVSDAITLLGRNATLFAEYYRNGFGVVGGSFDLASLPPDLVDRLARGQVFNTRRDYLAGGATLEATPLLSISPTLIVDLNDGSLIALTAASYSLGDNLTLVGGVQAPVGRAHSEFGGLPLGRSSPVLLAPPGQVYVQVRRYF
jgi:hypothetical protein